MALVTILPIYSRNLAFSLLCALGLNPKNLKTFSFQSVYSYGKHITYFLLCMCLAAACYPV